MRQDKEVIYNFSNGVEEGSTAIALRASDG
jgi:hypothetical protein